MSEELNVTKITSEILSDFSKSITATIWISIKKYVKDMKNKDEIDYGHAFEEYLRVSYNKYSKIKTLLYRHEPKSLYSFFECIGVSFNGDYVNTCSVRNLTRIGHKLIITGTGGIGKSTMMKHFFLNCIIEKSFIPVLIELRSINIKDAKDISILDILYENITNGRFTLEREYFLYSLETGCYLILFDGFDEVKQDKSEKITKEISSLCSKYPRNYYVVSSRPSDEFIGWFDFIELSSLTLTKEQALSLINKIDYDEDVKQSFYKELDATLYDKYKTFASNPLLLTIMLLTFENRASIPDKLNDFYEQAFAALYNVHDATKGAYKRDIKCGLGYEDFKHLFAYICFKSYFKSQYEFNEASLIQYINLAKQKFNKDFSSEDFKEDLVKSVCMLVREGLNYKFSHRSFQEYFAAWYTCKLTDSIQAKLIASWIKGDGRLYRDNYINMLFDLQTEKCNKIILLPGLKRLKSKYEQYNGSLGKIIRAIFNDIVIHQMSEKKEIRFVIKDKYLCKILSLAIRHNDYYSLKDEIRNDAEIIGLLEQHFPNRDAITFDELISLGIYEQIIDKLQWLKDEIEFALQLIPKYNEKTLGNKRSIQSIIDTL